MKRKRWLLVLAFFLLAPPSWADKKESYEKKIEQDLNDVSQKIEQWRRRSQKAGENGRKEILVQEQTIDEKLTEARRKLDELKSATAKSWKPLRAEIDRAVKDLHQTFSHVQSKKSDESKSPGGKKNE